MPFDEDSWEMLPYQHQEYEGERYITLEELEGAYAAFDSRGDELLRKLRRVLNPVYRGRRLGFLDRYLEDGAETVYTPVLRDLLDRYGGLVGEGLKLKDLEQHISWLKTGKNAAEIEVEGLPIDLCSAHWGFICGMSPDAKIQKYEVFLKSKSLLEALQGHLKSIGLDTDIWESEGGYRLRGNRIIGKIIQKGGFAVSRRQVERNVCFPEWVYESGNKDFHAALVAGVIESEGSVPSDSTRLCRITQSAAVEEFEDSALEFQRDHSIRTRSEESILSGVG